MLNRYKGVKRPDPFHEYDFSNFYLFYFTLTQVLEIHTILLKYTCIIRKLC